MKKLLSMLLALAAFVAASAQVTSVATLTHNGVTTPFTGVDAFRAAYEAAENGDVITLSAGNFNSCDIAKAITIYGEGYVDDEATNRKKTILNGEFSISPSTQTTSADFVLEGIYSADGVFWSGANNIAWLKKCRLYLYNTQSNGGELNIINCRVRGLLFSGRSIVNVYNSILADGGFPAIDINFINCILIKENLDYMNLDLRLEGCVLLNSIIISNYGDSIVPEENNVDYCFAFNSGTDTFKNFPNNNNHSISIGDFNTVYPNSTSGYSDEDLYILADDFPYLGNDGTQLGIHGGLYPFNNNPSYPCITKMEVDAQSSENGKINVNIQVANPQ